MTFTRPPAIERVLVVGAGTMGTQIGAVFALAGFHAVVADIDAAALSRSYAEVRQRLGRLAEKGQYDSVDVGAALARLSWTDDANAVAASTDFIVEAATEDLSLKRRIFAGLGQAAPAHTIFATNSSMIPSSELAEASGRADRLCNLHFFSPALVMKAVEVVPNPRTSPEVTATVIALAQRIGKQPVRLSQEIPGFIANRLMTALQDEAMSLNDKGIASIDDIDAAARLALGHPLGPFQLMDLVGLDVIDLMHRASRALTGNSGDLPPASLTARVDAGALGRKTGRGWYDYADAREGREGQAG